MPSYRGLTWDNPRGADALESSARRWARDADLDVQWQRHSLEGFESTPIRDLAVDYDLIVLDHPHLGSALADGSLRPIDEFFTDAELVAWEAATVGHSFDSYRVDGQTWALPLDAAAQVSAMRPSLEASAPVLWSDVDELSRTHPVALSLAGPHATATFASVCVGLETPVAEHEFVSPEAGEAAFGVLEPIAARAPVGSDALNPVEMLQRLASTGDIAYVPLVFGYVAFAQGPDGERVVFGDAPLHHLGARHGSTLGGAGLAFTQRCASSPELLDYARWLMSPETQVSFIPAHHGQPSAIVAWDSDALNVASGDFYRATRATLDDAWVRPRHAGYIEFQAAAGSIVREVLAGSRAAREGVELINDSYRGSRAIAPRQGVSS